MTLENEISQLVDPARNKLQGVLGLSSSLIKVVGRPGFVWVRLLDNPNEGVQAHNSKVSPSFDMPVLVAYDGLKYEVTGIDVSRYPNWGTDSAFYAEHAEQHSMLFIGGGGGDVVWIDSQQFLPSLVMPIGITGSTNVHVINQVYKNSNGTYLYSGNTGVYVPPSLSNTGSTIQMVIMSDADGSIYTQAGPIFSHAISGTANLIPYLPTTLTNPNDKPLAAIVRANDWSGSVIQWDDVIDVRQFMGVNSMSSGTSGGGTGTTTTSAPFSFRGNNSGTTQVTHDLTPQESMVLLAKEFGMWDGTNSEMELFNGSIPTGIDVSAYLNTLLVVPKSGTNDAGRVISFGYNSAPMFAGYRANGTLENPTALTNGKELFSYKGWGWDGSNWILGGAIGVFAKQAWSVGNNGTEIRFYAVNDGAVGVSQILTIRQSGTNLPAGSTYDIGGIPHTHSFTGSYEPSSPYIQLHINSSGTNPHGVKDTQLFMTSGSVVNNTSKIFHGFVPRLLTGTTSSDPQILLHFAGNDFSEWGHFVDQIDLPSVVATGSIIGTANIAARSDHVHAGNHTLLANIGTNTHAQIDTVLSTLDGGIWTPTIVSGTNVAASTAISSRYLRIGAVVFCSGLVQIDPAATGAVDFEMTLPIASNLASAVQLTGQGVSATGFPLVYIVGDAATDRAKLSFTATSAANQNIAFEFSYNVI